MPCLFCRNAVAAPSPCSLSSPDFNDFLSSLHVKLSPFPNNTPYLQSTSLVSIFSCLRGISWLPFYTYPHHCWFHFCWTCHLLLWSSKPSFPHFLVLTSLSIRALRVLCTSSPSLSISAFKRSFCSVSSCTFLSFSCSLSLRLFLAEE